MSTQTDQQVLDAYMNMSYEDMFSTKGLNRKFIEVSSSDNGPDLDYLWQLGDAMNTVFKDRTLSKKQACRIDCVKLVSDYVNLLGEDHTTRDDLVRASDALLRSFLNCAEVLAAPKGFRPSQAGLTEACRLASDAYSTITQFGTEGEGSNMRSTHLAVDDSVPKEADFAYRSSSANASKDSKGKSKAT